MNVLREEFSVSGGLPWLFVFGLPLLLAAGLISPTKRNVVIRMAPWATLPALLLAAAAPSGTMIVIPEMLLGAHLGVDTTGRVFLGFTALLWLLSGIYAQYDTAGDPRRHQFFGFFLVTMSGNLGLIIAQDLATFYLFFAMMSFAAYGLVVHNRNPEAREAAKIYMILVVIGEGLLFSAVILAASEARDITFSNLGKEASESPLVGALVFLTLAGFGVKAGALPLHVWLPLAHPAAPTPASAVLSGTMIKAGLLGWLRLLPLGEIALPGWGTLCIVAGLTAAFYGVALGITQNNPKTVLAYSSISQMGLMTIPVGLGLAVPKAWPAAGLAVLLYAAHHALAKGASFLGVTIATHQKAKSRWHEGFVAIGLFLPALALAGLPGTSGAVAKASLKYAKTEAKTLDFPFWARWGEMLLALAAVGTMLLMVRFLYLVWPRSQQHERDSELLPGMVIPWTIAWSGTLVIPLLLSWGGNAQLVRTSFDAATLWSNAWPVLLGLLVGGAVWLWNCSTGRRIDVRIPAGDVLILVRAGVQCVRGSLLAKDFPFVELVRRWSSRTAGVLFRVEASKMSLGFGVLLSRVEVQLGRWFTVGVLFLILIVIFFIAFAGKPLIPAVP